MGEASRGIDVLNVRHASRVAAISTAAGPARLLEAGLAEALAADGLPVQVVDVSAPEDGSLGEVATSFAVADRVARHVREALADDRFVAVLSGSCHAGLGSFSGMPAGDRGILWLDCHGDFNTPETTVSGLLDGTTLAAITGRCWKRMSSDVSGFALARDEDVLLVGVRSLDEGEKALLERSAIQVISTDEAGARGADVLRSLGERVDDVYVHVDLDVLDRSVGMANAYAEEGGFTIGELRSFLEEAMSRCPVRVVGFASYDPSTDRDGKVCDAAVEIAGAIAESVRS